MSVLGLVRYFDDSRGVEGDQSVSLSDRINVQGTCPSGQVAWQFEVVVFVTVAPAVTAASSEWVAGKCRVGQCVVRVAPHLSPGPWKLY